MKKKLLFVAALCCASASSYAQWTKPTLKNVDFTLKEVVNAAGETEQVSDTLYLYNTKAPGFFVGANDWNTRASVGSHGYKVIIKASDEYPGCYLICDSVETQNAVKAMFADNEQSIWVDNLDGKNVKAWSIEKNADGTYEITNKGTEFDTDFSAFKLGVAEMYQGEKNNTRLWLNNPNLTYKTTVNDEEVELPLFSGEFYDKWIFVTPKEYKEKVGAVEQYLTAMVLKSTLDKAKAEYDMIDFSAVEAVYNNTNSTTEELKAATDKIPVLISEYKSSLATYDEPIDFEYLIGDGSKMDPWTREFTGNGTVGKPETNTWSSEANNGADGTDMVTPFCQVWTASGGLLSDQKIFQTLKNAAPGLYKFTLNIRAYSEAGKLEKFEGMNMYFGDQMIDLQEQTPIKYSGNKSVLWSPNYFTIIAIVKEGGDIEFGLNIKNANFNWVAFKGTSLKYYGNKNVEENAAKLYKLQYKYDKAADDLVAQPEAIEAYNEAVDNFNAATTTEEIDAAVKAADLAKIALDNNVAAYKNLITKIEGWQKQMDENDYNSDLWGEFGDFMTSEEAASDEWPTPTAFDIQTNAKYTLGTEDITTYIETVDMLIQKAIATSIKEGDDCTNMIVNAAWKEADGAGWKEVSGKCTNKNLRGGLDAFPAAESWHSIFDFQQVVDNVPDGIYSISLNGFCRLDGENEKTVPAEIYMNEFASTLQNIADDGMNPDDAQDGLNCFISEGSWKNNPLFADNSVEQPAGYNLFDQTTKNENGWYTPNGMTGASIAFSADRYKATAYGLVQGGKMKIGVRNLKSTTVWALWSNFKLTFEGKNVEAIGKVLDSKIQAMRAYNETLGTEERYSIKAYNDIEKLIEDANNAGLTGNADVMWEALINGNANFAAAQELASAFETYLTAYTNMEDAANTYGDEASAEAIEAYQKYVDVDATVLDLEAITTLIENINATAAKLKVPAYDGASDSTPVDMSKVIVNATFDTVGDFTGWSGDIFGAGGTTSTCAEHYNKNYDTYQDILGLPAGTYEVGVSGFYRQGSIANDYAATTGADGATPKYNASLYAIGNGETCEAPIMSLCAGAVEGSSAPTTGVAISDDLGLAVPNSMADFTAWKEAGYYAPTDKFNKVVVKVGEDGKLRIGVKKTEKIDTDWSIFDDFTLVYYGTESTKVPTTEIAGTEAAGDAAPVSITTLSGVTVKSLVKGINIITKANGEKVKVYVK